MKTFLTIILIFGLISFVSAFDLSTTNSIVGVNIVPTVSTFDNATGSVNNSLYFDGYSVDSLWTHYVGLGNALWCKLTGCTMAGDINMADNDILDGGSGSYFNQTLLIDGDIGDENYNATLAINSGNNLYACINLTEGAGNLGFSICNDGSGDNRLVFANTYDGYEWMWIDRDAGTINFYNNTNTGEIAPRTTNTFSVGSSTKRYLKGWFSGLDVSGNINQTNGNTLINNIYGEMYNKSYGGFETIDLATTKVYVFITDVYCGSLNGFNCVEGSGNLTVQISGLYKVSLTISAEADGTAGEYGTKLFVNSVGKDNCYAFNDFQNADSDSGGFNCLVNLNAGDTINVGVDDHANPVRDLIINSYNLNLLRVGN